MPLDGARVRLLPKLVHIIWFDIDHIIAFLYFKRLN